jgi:hypothetical protein
MNDITLLTFFIEAQCGHEWHKHAATARVLQMAIYALLARSGARPGLRFEPDELPARRPASLVIAPGETDPDAIGLGIEAVVHALKNASPEERQRIAELFKSGDGNGTT